MSNIDKLISEVLELDEKAHKPRWWVGHISESHDNAADIDSEDGAVCDNVYTDHNRNLIIHYRTSAPKLARALQVAIEGLHNCAANNRYLFDSEPDAYKALDEIERILGEEK